MSIINTIVVDWCAPRFRDLPAPEDLRDRLWTAGEALSMVMREHRIIRYELLPDGHLGELDADVLTAAAGAYLAVDTRLSQENGDWARHLDHLRQRWPLEAVAFDPFRDDVINTVHAAAFLLLRSEVIAYQDAGRRDREADLRFYQAAAMVEHLLRRPYEGDG